MKIKELAQQNDIKIVTMTDNTITITKDIKKLAEILENEINSRVQELQKLARESEEIIARIDKINLEMYEIYKDLKPVEYMVQHHNPDMVILFTSLKDMFEKKK